MHFSTEHVTEDQSHWGHFKVHVNFFVSLDNVPLLIDPLSFSKIAWKLMRNVCSLKLGTILCHIC